MSETRALLLTDVADSTKLSEKLGDAAMAEVWTAHDRAARDLLQSWRGREIDKTDGMLLLFDGAADALQYAHAYHRALAALPVPLRARAGLHDLAGDLAEDVISRNFNARRARGVPQCGHEEVRIGSRELGRFVHEWSGESIPCDRTRGARQFHVYTPGDLP